MAREVTPDHDEYERLSLFAPIKIVNGFVTCDFMLGCYCCRFCLNRRYPDWNRLLERRSVYRNSLTVADAARLLGQVRAYTDARATLKVGHDTDMSLEEPEAQALVGLLPADRPITFMRRGILTPRYRGFYAVDRPNLLMKVTLTPRSSYLDYSNDPFPILDSFRGLVTPLFWAVGPVCHDNFEEACAIVDALPAGARVWVRELIEKGVPAFDKGSPARTAAEYRGEELRRRARDRGLQVVHYVNCLVRGRLGLGFHKRGEFVSEPNTWQLGWCEKCPALESCGREVPEEEAQERLARAMAEIDLTPAARPERFAHKSYRVSVREDVSFGDETWLREITGLKVDLSREGRKTGSTLSREIVARWRATRFFPVDEVLELGWESFRRAVEAGG